MNISELLKNFGLSPETILSFLDGDTIPAVAAVLNIDERLLSAIVKLAPLFLSGETDFKTLVPALLPTVVSYFASLSESKKNNPPDSVLPREEYSEYIEDFKKRSNGAFSPLEIYLQSDSAS